MTPCIYATPYHIITKIHDRRFKSVTTHVSLFGVARGFHTLTSSFTCCWRIHVRHSNDDLCLEGRAQRQSLEGREEQSQDASGGVDGRVVAMSAFVQRHHRPVLPYRLSAALLQLIFQRLHAIAKTPPLNIMLHFNSHS